MVKTVVSPGSIGSIDGWRIVSVACTLSTFISVYSAGHFLNPLALFFVQHISGLRALFLLWVGVAQCSLPDILLTKHVHWKFTSHGQLL